MKVKTTVRLLVAVGVLGVAVWFADRQAQSSRKQNALAGRLLDIPVRDIIEMTFESGPVTAACTRVGEEWTLHAPPGARADPECVAGILAALESLPAAEVITPGDLQDRALRLDDFGLTHPRATIGLTDRLHRRRVLQVGTNAPIGGLIYVKFDGRGDIIATAPAVTNIVPESAECLRDRALIAGSMDRVVRIEIQVPGRAVVELTRTDAGWAVVRPEPAGTRADLARVTALLNRLFGLRVNRFITSVPAVSAPGEVIDERTLRIRHCMLLPEKAALRLTIWNRGDTMGTELLVGKVVDGDPALVYAKMRDSDFVVSIARADAEDLALSVNDLRDRSLFSLVPDDVRYVAIEKSDRKLVLRRDDTSGWGIREPVQWKADDHEVAALIASVAAWQIRSFADAAVTNLAAVGLDAPACSLQLLTVVPTNGEAAVAQADDGTRVPRVFHRLLIGTPVAGRESVFVRFEDEPVRFGDGATVYELPLASFRQLPVDLANPLLYRDRTMLALRPESIRRIVLRRGPVEEVIERGESGRWSAPAPATNAVNPAVLDDILFAAANLRALRIESDTTRNVQALGLDASGVTLSFGLAGDAGIQKTLILGYRAKMDGIYAMVQGQDVVFVLERTLAERLMRSLWSAAPAPAGRPATPVP